MPIPTALATSPATVAARDTDRVFSIFITVVLVSLKVG
jgi:hypothetical protein